MQTFAAAEEDGVKSELAGREISVMNQCVGSVLPLTDLIATLWSTLHPRTVNHCDICQQQHSTTSVTTRSDQRSQTYAQNSAAIWRMQKNLIQVDTRTALWFFLHFSFFLVSVIVKSFSFLVFLFQSLISPITVCFLTFLFFTFAIPFKIFFSFFLVYALN